MKYVDIYTDGACSGNPGPGGWAAILIYNGKEKSITGRVDYTTNNRMEMTAVIKALYLLKEKCRVCVTTDSNYIVSNINGGHVYKWIENDFKGKKNSDLWTQLLYLMEQHVIEFVHVKGHSDNEYNNRCDKLAVLETKKGEYE